MIKILESNNIKDLELQANKFITDKKVLHTSMASTTEAGEYFKTTEYQVLIEYEDKK